MPISGHLVVWTGRVVVYGPGRDEERSTVVKHVASLDGLRGIAVLLVVAFHYFPREVAGPFSAIASAGWMGVDVFFALSGYLITTILYDQRGREQYFRNFYMRRVLRLFPLYYSLFLFALVLTPVLHIQWRPGHLVMVFYGANLVLPFDGSLRWLGPFNLFHTWSLAVEEQFYLVWPWLVGSRMSKRTLRRVCFAGAVGAPLLRLALLHANVQPWLIYQSLPTRIDSLLAGALLALMPLPSLRAARIAGGVAVVVLGFVIWKGHSSYFLTRSMQGLGYSALALLSVAVLVMSLWSGTVAQRVCSWGVLRFYGRYSYGLYLLHYWFSRAFRSLQDWIMQHSVVPAMGAFLSFSVILFCSTLMAVASYRWLEQPFLRLKERFSPEPAKQLSRV
jgi:peptidoglycan/LPS O-acetylase OafA/YrhL